MFNKSKIILSLINKSSNLINYIEDLEINKGINIVDILKENNNNTLYSNQDSQSKKSFDELINELFTELINRNLMLNDRFNYNLHLCLIDNYIIDNNKNKTSNKINYINSNFLNYTVYKKLINNFFESINSNNNLHKKDVDDNLLSSKIEIDKLNDLIDNSKYENTINDIKNYITSKYNDIKLKKKQDNISEINSYTFYSTEVIEKGNNSIVLSLLNLKKSSINVLVIDKQRIDNLALKLNELNNERL